MSNRIERPLFYEHQILGAADLTVALEHSRGQQARHERFLHLWGIASGLDVTGKEKQTAAGTKYQEITLSPGVAIDGTGREIVVPEAERLSDDLFDQLNVAIADKDAWYPVFLIGRDEPAPQPPLVVGACQNSQPTRQFEGYEVTFGRLGDELDLDKQDAPGVAEGPGDAAWKVLLGFVQWDAGIKKFKAVADGAGGISRRYAGVQADIVAARGGRLTLRTRSPNEAGKPALIIDETENGLLQFGKLTAQGVVTPVFSVNEKGDIKAEGKIIGALTTGGVQVESGIATDGMILPLPPGITQKQVDDGDAVVQVQISLRLGENATPGSPTSFSLTANLAATPLETWVDSERRLHCRVRWFEIGGGSPNIEDHPGACHYLVLASVKEKQP